MRVDILTIFPRFFGPFLTQGMVRRARDRGQLEVRVTDLRAFTEGRHRTVDDRPYGGGPGMLLKPEPVFRALDVLGIPESGSTMGRDEFFGSTPDGVETLHGRVSEDDASAGSSGSTPGGVETLHGGVSGDASAGADVADVDAAAAAAGCGWRD